LLLWTGGPAFGQPGSVPGVGQTTPGLGDPKHFSDNE